MSKFKRSKIAAVRSYPESFTRFHTVAVGEKLVYGELVVVCERKTDATLGYEISGDKKDGEQIVQIGSTKHIDVVKVVDTLKRNFQVGDGACLDMVNALKTRECDRIKPKRRMVSSLRDFPKDLKSYEVVDKKSQKHCVGKSGDSNVPDDHESKEVHVKGTKDKSDVDLELHDEALKNEETVVEFKCGEDVNSSYSMVENVSLVKNASEDAENPHLQHELCSLVYPCWLPKRRKVSAVRDFPDSLKILKARNEASEKTLNHRAANKSAGENETTCDFQDDVEHIETQIESQESSVPTEKGLSRNLMTLLTPSKKRSVKFGANTVYKLTRVGHDRTDADKQEPVNCGANSTPSSTQSSSEVTNSNKRIGGKEIGVTCVNKTILEDSVATPRCPSIPSQRYRSDTKINQDKCKGKDKVLKRKQNEGSAHITVVLALMAPTKCPC